MKYLATLIAALFLGALAYLLVQKFIAPPGPVITADLVPAETDIFLTFPDLPATAQRWEQSPLGQMVTSPRLQPFFRRPLTQVFQSTEMSTAQRLLRDLQIEELWAAVRFPTIDQPQWMVAFRARGPEAAVTQTLLRLQETLTDKGAIEPWGGDGFTGWQSRLTLPTGEVQTIYAVHGLGWAVIGNATASLADLRDRLNDQAPSPSLNDDPDFQKSVQPLDGESDVLFYAATRRVVEKFRTFAEAEGEQPIPTHFARLERWQSFAFASLLGPETRERTVLRGALPEVRPLSRLAQPLAPANSLFLWEGHTDTSWIDEETTALLPAGWQAGLQAAGLSPEALRTALGDQAGLVVWWPSASLLPAFVGVAEVREAEVVRQEMSRLGGLLAGDAMVTQTGDLTTLTFRADALMGLVSPTLGFQGDTAYLSINPGDLARALNTPASGDGWTTTPAWTEAASFLNAGDWQRSLLDVPGVVDRVLTTLQPMLAFASALDPSLASAIDVTLLPESSDLRPFLGAVRSRERILPGEGLLGETIGAITWSSLWLTLPAGLPDGWKTLSSVAEEAP